MADEDQRLYLQDLGLEASGLERLIKAYDRLGLQSFLTAGEKEVRAWTIRKGTTAPEAAGVIHTDFEKISSKPKWLIMKILWNLVVGKACVNQENCGWRARII